MPGRPRHLRFATTNVRQPIASAAGRGGRQDRLFYSFNLDDHVPRSHLLRGIDRFFDLSELRHHLAPFYSHTGRPSIDPELMIRMLIVGYCVGISPTPGPNPSIASWATMACGKG